MKQAWVKGADLNHIRIGDVMLCEYPNTHSDGTLDGTSKLRPVMIWGVYRNVNDEIIGFDVFKMTTQTDKYYLNSLFISPENFNKYYGNKNDRGGIADAGHIMTSPIGQFNVRRGVLRSLNPKFIPDLISCRVNGINANPVNRFMNFMTHGGCYLRDGVFFRGDLVQPIQSSHNPHTRRPDVDDFKETSLLTKRKVNEYPFTQNDIDAITRWTVAYFKMMKEKNYDFKHNGKFISIWPPKGLWPQWPDVKIDGQIVACCSDENVILRATPETDRERKTTIDAVTKPTAAALRAKQFANFKLG